MHKKFKEFFEQNQIAINGSKAHGVLNGYQVNYTVMNPTVIHIAFYATEDQRNAIANAVKLLVDKNTRYQFDKYGVSFAITDNWTIGRVADKTIKLSNDVCDILKNNGALGVGYCPVCGSYTTAENSSERNVDGMLITIDNDCVNQINEAIRQENLEFENAPNNYFKGFLGALIGGLVGAVIAIILNLVGFVAGISSFVAVVVGLILYRKFGGKPNKMMLVIVTVTTFVMMIIAVVSIYVVVAVIAAAEAGASVGAFGAFAILMKEEPEFARYFYIDLGLTLLFTAIGCVSEIIKTAQSIKRNKNI